MRFKISPLQSLGNDFLCNSKRSAHSDNLIDSRSQQSHHSTIDGRWIQSLMKRFRIVSRANTLKYRCRPAKERGIEMAVSLHMGTVNGMFLFAIMD